MDNTRTMTEHPMLQIKNLAVDFNTARGQAHILEGVDFELFPKEILALVGETGSGKSVTAKSILCLLPKSLSQSTGEVWFKKDNLLTLSNGKLQKIRGHQISMVFQNPQSSINPVFTLGEQISRLIRLYLPDQIESVMKLNNCSRKKAIDTIAEERLNEVGLTDVQRLLKSYAGQVSGGMAQRYRIALALLSSPKILIADEATSALDVTVQAHILKLMREICQKKKTAILFITHDLGIAAQICNRVAVMYSGRIVEIAPTEDIFKTPYHPYTQGLLKAVPKLGQKEALAYVPGMIPDLANPPKGCRFHPRCTYTMDVCRRRKPPMTAVGLSHRVACFLYDNHPKPRKVEI